MSKITINAGEWSCLISFVWASPSCEEREVSKRRIQNEKNLQRDSNQQPSAPKVRFEIGDVGGKMLPICHIFFPYIATPWQVWSSGYKLELHCMTERGEESLGRTVKRWPRVWLHMPAHLSSVTYMAEISLNQSINQRRSSYDFATIHVYSSKHADWAW